MDASSRVRYLLHIYTNGTATPAEKQELMDLFRQPGYEQMIEKSIGAEMELLERPGTDMHHPIPEERSTTILSNILQTAQPKKIKPRWLWQAAAAVIILIAGAGTYQYLEKNKTQSAITSAPKRTDPAPGTNKAILQLADGSTVTLDNEHPGKLAQQGKTSVIKLDSGRLTYKPENEATATVLYNTLTTPRGGQYQLTLPDGTKVWLNAASSIRYPTAFTSNERTVTITGEAYFEVAKNDKMPFIVSAGESRTIVLGTHFNINAYDDEQSVRTTLLEGAVKVATEQKEKLLHPGQQAEINRQTKTVVVQETDTYRTVAWKNGQFDFDNTDLSAIMRQISRWYDIDIDFRSQYDGARFGGGISRQLQLSEVLRLLDKSGVHTTLENGKLIVLP